MIDTLSPLVLGTPPLDLGFFFPRIHERRKNTTDTPRESLRTYRNAENASGYRLRPSCQENCALRVYTGGCIVPRAVVRIVRDSGVRDDIHTHIHTHIYLSRTMQWRFSQQRKGASCRAFRLSGRSTLDELFYDSSGINR